MLLGVIASSSIKQYVEELTPPNIGEYWSGQGGYYAGIFEVYSGEFSDSQGFFHMIVGDKASEGVGVWATDDTITLAYDWSDDGFENTQTIVASGRLSECPAFAGCVGYTADGHSDFFLPSGRELNVIIAALKESSILSNPFSTGGSQAFDSTWYWGSDDRWDFRPYEGRLVYPPTRASGYSRKTSSSRSGYAPTRYRPVRRIPVV